MIFKSILNHNFKNKMKKIIDKQKINFEIEI